MKRSGVSAVTVGLGLVTMALSLAALGQLQPPSKEQEDALLKAQQRVEYSRNAANNANRQVREAESSLATARARQRAANDGVTRAERALEEARAKAAAAVQAYNEESAAFQELRRAQSK